MSVKDHKCPYTEEYCKIHGEKAMLQYRINELNKKIQGIQLWLNDEHSTCEVKLRKIKLIVRGEGK